MRSLGADCVAMKPLASGCQWQSEVLESEDASFLSEVGGFDVPPPLLCPVRLELPLAPLVAAQQSGVDTSEWAALTHSAFEELQRRHEWVIVEGVGGWYVPLWEVDGATTTCADLVSSWNLPVVVVARRTLGTINHTVLTCRAVQSQAELLGVVFCDAEDVGDEDVAAQTSPGFTCELAAARQLGFVPHSCDWELGAQALMPLARELLARS